MYEEMPRLGLAHDQTKQNWQEPPRTSTMILKISTLSDDSGHKEWQHPSPSQTRRAFAHSFAAAINQDLR